MSKKQVDIELPSKVKEIIDTQFNLSENKILKYIPKSLKIIASNGYYPDTDSLQQGCGLKDIADIH